jgi:hypothetical protein
MTDKEAMKLALDALGAYMEATDDDEDAKAHWLMDKAFFTLKERLENPMREVQRLGQEIEQEPLIGCVNHDCAKCKEKNT